MTEVEAFRSRNRSLGQGRVPRSKREDLPHLLPSLGLPSSRSTGRPLPSSLLRRLRNSVQEGQRIQGDPHQPLASALGRLRTTAVLTGRRLAGARTSAAGRTAVSTSPLWAVRRGYRWQDQGGGRRRPAPLRATRPACRESRDQTRQRTEEARRQGPCFRPEARGHRATSRSQGGSAWTAGTRSQSQRRSASTRATQGSLATSRRTSARELFGGFWARAPGQDSAPQAAGQQERQPHALFGERRSPQQRAWSSRRHLFFEHPTGWTQGSLGYVPPRGRERALGPPEGKDQRSLWYRRSGRQL